MSHISLLDQKVLILEKKNAFLEKNSKCYEIAIIRLKEEIGKISNYCKNNAKDYV